MAFPFRKILCPVDFDENSMKALDVAADLARQNEGTALLLHVVSMIVVPARLPGYFDLYLSQGETARARLKEIAHKRLAGLKYEILAEMGDPADIIVTTGSTAGADLIVMATNGRRGFSRLLLGSVAERVLRQSTCPVLTVRYSPAQRDLVSTWMTRNPVTAAPDEKLSSVRGKILQHRFDCIPIVKDGALVGIVTDHDLYAYAGHADQTEAIKAMTEAVITVRSSTTVREAARLLSERGIRALPVVENGNLAGIITTSDVLSALVAQNEPSSRS
jgi:nucleotide-binding universal stress UspA family protein/predicted transcriptional regulator